MASSGMSEWGRIADDGTVFVRTGDAEGGERPVGSWHAGTPEQGLAHFVRRFEQMATEVALLEQRLRSGAGDPRQAATSAERLKTAIPAAAAVGDLGSLERRVDVLLASTAAVVEQARLAKVAEREQAAAAKALLADEVDQLAGSSEWRVAGERLRTIGEEWKRLGSLDRTVEDELWSRVVAARKHFADRRTAHFGALEEQREVSRGRKEKLIAEAETLAVSTDWKAGADRFKQLMSDWKAAGRAPREVEDTLWASFKGAQDRFFSARNEQFATQDQELRGNQEVKEALLVEAEQIDPAQGLDKAQRRLRELQDRWEVAGKLPREVMRSFEDRMAAVEQRIRDASSVTSSKPIESSFTVKLRERVIELEEKLAKAQAVGRPTEELEAALATQRQWLAQAAGGPSPVSQSAGGQGKPDAGRPVKPRTTGWVRADA